MVVAGQKGRFGGTGSVRCTTVYLHSLKIDVQGRRRGQQEWKGEERMEDSAKGKRAKEAYRKCERAFRTQHQVFFPRLLSSAALYTTIMPLNAVRLFVYVRRQYIKKTNEHRTCCAGSSPLSLSSLPAPQTMGRPRGPCPVVLSCSRCAHWGTAGERGGGGVPIIGSTLKICSQVQSENVVQMYSLSPPRSLQKTETENCGEEHLHQLLREEHARSNGGFAVCRDRDCRPLHLKA